MHSNSLAERRALRHSEKSRLIALLVLAALAPSARAATNAPVSGEIQRITLDSPNDVWSGGTIVVGGQVITVPRNLLIDLPANRLTLQQIFARAPAACIAARETGLAKGDTCNTSGTGGIATVAANRTNGGNVIAGDLFIEKGIEAITGTITFIDYTDGYFRLNGTPGNRDDGVMVRLNDPDARHTIQQGRGCAGGPNCSPDPRFTLDPDNYTNTFSTGYPLCVPSATARPVPAVLNLGVTTSQAAADGSGDALCPRTNRIPNGTTSPPPVNGNQPVADSRRLAPILVGDPITVEGNWEVVAGVRFLSAHSSMVSRALSTQPGQPDYLFLDEVEVDAAGFQNERARTLIIGYATLAPADVLIWSVHYDPVNNAPHEFPLASSQGCDAAAGPGTCTAQGIVGAGANIFKIRHDVDFILGQTGAPAKPRLSPCSHLRADPRFAALNLCPSAGPDGTSTLAEELSILAPIPREIQARTGNSLANPGLVTVDVSGNQATNGQYLFPFGMGLGGVSTPEFNEINLDALGTPFIFDGLPWAMDRRLSPGGCDGTCEPSPQPLDPFPFGGLDPRTQAATPQGPYFDPNYSETQLSRAIDRVLSYVDGDLGKFNGDATVLAWPPRDPPSRSIPVTPEVALVCTAPVPPAPVNTPPVATGDSTTTISGLPVALAVLANDFDPDGDPLLVTAVTNGIGGLVSTDGTNVFYSPLPGFTGADAFSYTIEDGRGGIASAAANVIVLPLGNSPPVALSDTASTSAGTPVVIDVLANDTDPDGNVLAIVGVTNGTGGTVAHDGGSVTYQPAAGFSGTDTFTYTIADGQGATATAEVTVAVAAPEALIVTLAEFRLGAPNEWRVTGTTTAPGARITIFIGPTLGGQTLATVTADALGAWTFRQRNATVLPDATRTISLSSTGGSTRLGIPVTVRN